MNATNEKRVVSGGALAGLCGGIAEIVWVTVYSNAAGSSALAVAAEVAATVAPAAAGLPAAPVIGIAIHMLLSVALGVIFSFALSRSLSHIPGRTATILVAVATLLAVWAINCFILLPAINPAFVALMPLPAMLVSKLLFGLTMGWILQTPAAAPGIAVWRVSHFLTTRK